MATDCDLALWLFNSGVNIFSRVAPSKPSFYCPLSNSFRSKGGGVWRADLDLTKGCWPIPMACPWLGPLGFILRKYLSCIYVYIHVYSSISMCIRVYSRVSPCIPVYSFIFVCIRAYSCIFVYVRVYSYILIAICAY